MLTRDIDKSCAVTRVSVPALDEILGWAFPVLDHGFVRVIDYMGDDTSIIQAARVSYGRGTRHVNEDRGLIRYLMRNRHSTPAEMCEIKFHCKLPIFVARQFIRHRTASVNEYSARYSILDKEFYVPEPEHLAAQSTTNRQGRGDVLEQDEAEEVMHILRTDAERCYGNYTSMLNEGPDRDPTRASLARELARMNLTLNTYTQWYWKVDLHNLFNFLRLRADAHAQYEIRVYADEMQRITKLWVPQATEAFVDYVQNARTFSAMQLNFLRYLLTINDTPTMRGNEVFCPLSSVEIQHQFGLGGRELDEFWAILRN